MSLVSGLVAFGMTTGAASAFFALTATVFWALAVCGPARGAWLPVTGRRFMGAVKLQVLLKPSSTALRAPLDVPVQQDLLTGVGASLDDCIQQHLAFAAAGCVLVSEACTLYSLGRPGTVLACMQACKLSGQYLATLRRKGPMLIIFLKLTGFVGYCLMLGWLGLASSTPVRGGKHFLADTVTVLCRA